MKGYNVYTILIGWVIAFVIAYFLQIDPSKEYGWWGGFWQGIFIVPHWIMSWFDSDILVRAVYRTTGYNIWWWIQLFLVGYSWLSSLIRLILSFRHK